MSKRRKYNGFPLCERKRLIAIGIDLMILQEDDIRFMLDPVQTEFSVRSRLTTKRLETEHVIPGGNDCYKQVLKQLKVAGIW